MILPWTHPYRQTNDPLTYVWLIQVLPHPSQGTSRRWGARLSLTVFFKAKFLKKMRFCQQKILARQPKLLASFFFEAAEKSQKSVFFRIRQKHFLKTPANKKRMASQRD